jgi:hypothetical protein
MDPNIKIKFSRNGIEIGEHKLWEVEVMIKTFKIFPTDHYWHEGMTQWEPVTKLLALIDIAKEDAEIAKQKRANEIEKREAAEFKQSNYFNCNCCRINFEKSEGLGERFTRGIVFILFSYFFGIAALFALGRQKEDGFFSFFGALVVLGLALVFIVGIGFTLAAFVRSPSCPKCGSSNFAKPEKPELSPKQ